MTKLLLTSLFLAISLLSPAQQKDWQQYEPSEEHPYGLRNPDAPEQFDDFAPMIGTCDCKALSRNPDATWADTTAMVWTFKYILNGNAIQDLGWSDQRSSTSIRQFHPDSLQWVVGYNSTAGATTTLPTWLGQREGDDIVLRRPQKAPNGMDGVSKLTFTNIRDDGFEWRGEWINEAQQIVYPFRLIWCSKRK